MAHHVEEVRFEKNDTIMKQGEVGDRMYMLQVGQVEVIAGSADTRLATLDSGSVFGEMAVLTKTAEAGRRSATVHTITPCMCFVISRTALLTVLECFPKERDMFAAVSEKRLKELKEKSMLGKPSEVGSRRPRRSCFLPLLAAARMKRRHTVDGTSDMKQHDRPGMLDKQTPVASTATPMPLTRWRRHEVLDDAMSCAEDASDLSKAVDALEQHLPKQRDSLQEAAAKTVSVEAASPDNNAALSGTGLAATLREAWSCKQSEGTKQAQGPLGLRIQEVKKGKPRAIDVLASRRLAHGGC